MVDLVAWSLVNSLPSCTDTTMYGFTVSTRVLLERATSAPAWPSRRSGSRLAAPPASPARRGARGTMIAGSLSTWLRAKIPPTVEPVSGSVPMRAVERTCPGAARDPWRRSSLTRICPDGQSVHRAALLVTMTLSCSPGRRPPRCRRSSGSNRPGRWGRCRCPRCDNSEAAGHRPRHGRREGLLAAVEHVVGLQLGVDEVGDAGLRRLRRHRDRRDQSEPDQECAGRGRRPSRHAQGVLPARCDPECAEKATNGAVTPGPPGRAASGRRRARRGRPGRHPGRTDPSRRRRGPGPPDGRDPQHEGAPRR